MTQCYEKHESKVVVIPRFRQPVEYGFVRNRGAEILDIS